MSKALPPLLTAEEEAELIGRVRAGEASADCRAARDRLVEANLRLVTSVARRHVGGSKLDFPDLVQEGSLGLLRAIETFDAGRGVRFGTYATWWIREAIGRAVADKGRTVRLPVRVQHTLHELNRVRAEMTEANGRQPSLQELADRLGWREERLVGLLGAARQEPVSLSQPIGEDDDGELGDLVAQRPGTGPEEAVLDAELRKAAVEAVGSLDEREQLVLRLRFGLGGGTPRTLHDIGHMLSLSGERVRQVERAGLERVRAALGPD